MRGILVSGALGAILVGSLVATVNAAEDASVCTTDQKTLTITIPENEPSAELDKGSSGNVIVRLDSGDVPCTDANGKSFQASTFESIVLGQAGEPAPTAWLVSATVWGPTITLHNDPADTLALTGSADADDWRAVVGERASLSLDSDPSGDLILDAMPSGATFDTGAGDDVVDLAGGWTSATSIVAGAGADTIRGGVDADEIDPGVGADNVEAGLGDDRVSVAADDEPDRVQPGAGDDELDLSAAGASGATVDPTQEGGDGVAGNDSYGSFETVLGTAGPDRFVAPPKGMTAIGGSGGDTFVSGPRDDTFHGGDVDDPTEEMGKDTVSYARADAGIMLEPAGDPGVERATSGGVVDRLASVERLIGSPRADRVETAAIEWVRPGRGNDKVGFERGKGYIVAEPRRDGNDASLSCATWDYSRRAAPLSLTADGRADDGMRDEADNVGARCKGVTIVGGSGGDRIVGDGGRNVLSGSAGADRITGRSRGDYLWGGGGADQVAGGDGPDNVAGGSGNDTIRETGRRPNGADVLHGDGGRDILTYAGRSSGVTVTNGNARCDDGAHGEGDCVTRHDPFEVIVGTDSADRLASSGRGERFFGRRGPDVLLGHQGSDGLFGSAGDDRLIGGPGRDVLKGGGSADRFFARDSTKDTLRGGYGRDRARRDRIDAAYSIEGTL